MLQIYSGLLGDKMGYALSKTDYYHVSEAGKPLNPVVRITLNAKAVTKAGLLFCGDCLVCVYTNLGCCDYKVKRSFSEQPSPGLLVNSIVPLQMVALV